jgi:hypothetical protein
MWGVINCRWWGGCVSRPKAQVLPSSPQYKTVKIEAMKLHPRIDQAIGAAFGGTLASNSPHVCA